LVGIEVLLNVGRSRNLVSRPLLLLAISLLENMMDRT
jgi:hypothetical protein